MFFVLSRAWDKEKILKNCHISSSIYKHDAIDIANPNSMQDACHMNLVIDPAHRRVCGLVVEHRSAEAEGRDKTKNIFFYIFTELKTHHPSYSIIPTSTKNSN